MKASFHIKIFGAVQGVGFRPFIYRLATEMKLAGWVKNSSEGVLIEVEGAKNLLEQFLFRIEREKPKIAAIHHLDYAVHDSRGYSGFKIRKSRNKGEKTASILPDIATCPDCLGEMWDPEDRRYRYPFINCTNCGPRFSILEALPYDRPMTAMKDFKMCPDCLEEYHNPENRRFHAQPNACWVCGPDLELWNTKGMTMASGYRALQLAAKTIWEGKIVAFKGIGGFQLLADARNRQAVALLRKRKRRLAKPFALMYPDINAVREVCKVSVLEQRLLQSSAAPIVLLERRGDIITESPIAINVAKENPNLGIMMPYSPMHHLLMRELGFPIVATSGNLVDEPICTDNCDAIRRLSSIADVFLVHDRPVVRHLDDSVVRVVAGREQVLRRARGYAPLPIYINQKLAPSIAVGAHLKNTIAVTTGNKVFMSQHIGDLETVEAFTAFRKVIGDFKQLYEIKPLDVVVDLHPEYLSAKHGHKMNIPIVAVQHHYAHVLSCMADNKVEGTVLGTAWDGTGLGTDGSIWGGEFLLCREGKFKRVAHLRNFRLPGGEVAIKNPSRTALGLLYEIFGKELFQLRNLAPIRHCQEGDLAVIRQMLQNGVNAPVTSSMGRLFDAVAALVDLCQHVDYEGQAALALEYAVEYGITDEYSFVVKSGNPLIVDWEPMILQILADSEQRIEPGIIATKFHNTLAKIILAVAREVGELKVVLSGGCFQNKYLTERTIDLLALNGFKPYWHQQIPPNDGGIAVGQIMSQGKKIRKVGTHQRMKAL